ncbi:MAG: hypothetical protein IIU47_08820, partial [Lachnospiraceae bacterium]|nr:hypothetical protein [Lachnospiraceae bacterium]
EYIDITVDAEGITSFRWQNPVELVETVSENVQVVSFDEARKGFDTYIDILRSAGNYIGGNSTIEITDIVFGYEFIPVRDSLSVFDMVLLQSSVSASLFRAGREAAEYAWYARYALEGGEEEAASLNDSLPARAAAAGLSLAWVSGRTEELVRKENPSGAVLSGGISLLGSEILSDGGEIYLTASYRATPPYALPGLPALTLQSTYAGHAWTGFRLSEWEGEQEEAEDEIVYITDRGSVYHRDRACTYLSPSVRSVQGALVSGERSLGGAVYYPCEYCRPSDAGCVFITSYGNRYHGSASCSAIHRNVREVPLKSVEGRMRPCSKCG